MMKFDDPRLIESHKHLTEEVKKLDDMIVTVLKYHVSVERSMVELIGAHGKGSRHLLKKANRLRNGRQYPGAAAGRTVSLIRSQPYQPSPKGGSGRPAHHPFEVCSAFTRVTACTLALSLYIVTR
jgi:hypothetical protein